jgi:hypothetical protein
MTKPTNSPNPNIRRNAQAASQAVLNKNRRGEWLTSAAAEAVANKYGRDCSLMFNVASSKQHERAYGEAALLIAAIIRCIRDYYLPTGEAINGKFMHVETLARLNFQLLAQYGRDPMMYAVWSEATQADWT